MDTVYPYFTNGYTYVNSPIIEAFFLLFMAPILQIVDLTTMPEGVGNCGKSEFKLKTPKFSSIHAPILGMTKVVIEVHLTDRPIPLVLA